MIDEVAHDDAAIDDGPVSTGNAAVDDVLASLEGLEERPLDEHVAVFERAHEQLRGALDGSREP